MSDSSTFIGMGTSSDNVSTGSGDASGQGVMTERVQALANSVYREFAQVVNQYGEGPVTSLMPIVITVLESLDGALTDLNDSQRALEEATDDNEQLHAQYEKEKQIRRDEQTRRIRNEDQGEDERRDLRQQVEQVAVHNRQLKSQLGATKERADRGDEKNEKLKHEVVELQLKYRRMNNIVQQQKSNVSQQLRPRTSSGARVVRTESPSTQLLDPPQVLEIAPFEMATRSVGLVSPLSSVEHGAVVSSAVRRQPVALADEFMDFHPSMASSPLPPSARPLRAPIAPLQAVSPADETSSVATSDSEEPVPVAEERPRPPTDDTLLDTKDDASDNTMEDMEQGEAKEEPATATPMSPVEDEPVSRMGESLEAELFQANKSMDKVEEQPLVEEEADQASPEDQDEQTSAEQREDEAPQAAAPTDAEEAEQRVDEIPQAAAPTDAEEAAQRVDEIPQAAAAAAAAAAPMDAIVVETTEKVPDEDAFSNASVSQQDVMEEMLSLRMDSITSREEGAMSADRPVGLQDASSMQDLASDRSSPESIEMDFGADELEIERLMGQVRDLEQALDQRIAEKEDTAQQLAQISQEHTILEGRVGSVEQERSEMQTKLRAMEADLQERTDRLEELERREQENQEPLFPGANDDETSGISQKRQYSRVEMSRLLRERNEFKERYLSLKEKLQILQQQQQQEVPTSKKKEKTLWKMFSDMIKGKSSKTGPALRAHSTTKFAPLKTDDHEPLDSSSSTSSVPGALTLAGRRFEAYGWSLPEAMAPQSMTSSSRRPSAGLQEKTPEFNRLDTVPVLMHCGHLAMDTQDQLTFSATRTWCSAAVCSTVQSNPSLHPSDTVCPSSLVWVCTGTSELSRVNVLDANMPGEVIDSFPVCSSPILCVTSVPGVEDDESMIHIASATEDSSVLTPNELDQYRYRSPGQSPPLQISPDHFMNQGKGKGKSPQQARAGTPKEKVISLREAFQDSPTPTRRDHSDSLSGEAMARPRLRLPTMWMGAEFGCLYIHSAVSMWRGCLHAMKVEASVLSIVYAQRKVFVGMANSSLAIFSRSQNEWDWEGYKVAYLGPDRDVPISVMVPVKHRVWCGVANKVYVVNADTNKVETHFKVHPSVRSRVLSLVTSGDGVWVSVRLDSTLRLFHADTFQNLQDVDVAKPIQTLLTFPGSKRKPSPRNLVRISTLLISNNCLWIGASNGTIVSLPLTNRRPVEGSETPRGTNVSAANLSSFSILGEDVTATSTDDSIAMAVADGSFSTPNIPYLSLDASRLSFHGHVHTVDCLVATPGVMATRTVKVLTDGGSTPKRVSSASVTFVVSVGGGYVDFRSDSTSSASGGGGGGGGAQSADRNHLIVWQVSPSNTDLL